MMHLDILQIHCIPMQVNIFLQSITNNFINKMQLIIKKVITRNYLLICLNSQNATRYSYLYQTTFNNMIINKTTFKKWFLKLKDNTKQLKKRNLRWKTRKKIKKNNFIKIMLFLRIDHLLTTALPRKWIRIN
jgi:hypothetical protein